MCGRYASTRSAADLTTLFEAVDETSQTVAASYNLAPTDPVPIVRQPAGRPERVLSVARWGLVPAWAPDTSRAARMINARAETVATSRVYGPLFNRRRCVVPADGWYEWVRNDGGKQAYFMHRADGAPLAFAGLWSVWGTGETRLLTCSVITIAAVGDLAGVHSRMPLVLTEGRWPAWLSAADAGPLLAPPAPAHLAELAIRPVGPAVGDVRNDGPDLIRPVDLTGAEPSTVDSIDLTLF